MTQDSKNLKVYIIAGEPSGDMIGSSFLQALKRQFGGNITLRGIAGEKMKALGVTTIFEQSEIAIMGFLEVLPKIFKIKKLIQETVSDILAFDPDIIITIDSFGFNSRVMRGVRERQTRHIKAVHYVAPTVWAYKPKRAQVCAELYDHILLLLPFEKPYFDKVGLPATFVGHMLAYNEFNIRKLDKSRPLNVIFMPGSRNQEIERLGKIFAKSLELIRENYEVNIFIPTLPRFEDKIRAIFPGCTVFTDSTQKAEAIKSADLAIVKSGTSSLEMASYGIPTIVCYKLNHLSYWYIKSLVKVKYISLVNLLLGMPVVPELIQNNCTPQSIKASFSKLIEYRVYDYTVQQYDIAMKMLRPDRHPSEIAADVVLRIIQ